MAIMTVNPTRMELTRLKKRLATARRGHKLLKDKQDELMRQFLDLVRENKILREKVDELLLQSNKDFVMARSVMSRQTMTTALMVPKQKVTLDVSSRNLMSVNIPVFKTKTKTENNEDIYSYGYAFTSSQLDEAVKGLGEALPELLRLAQVEKSVDLLATEIEKTRRRVNALEHVMIPNLADTIKSITMKLDENERGSITRLMKVKDMMVEEQIRKDRQRDAEAAI